MEGIGKSRWPRDCRCLLMTRKRLILALMFTVLAGCGFVFWYLARPARPPRDRSIVSHVVDVSQWTADGHAIVEDMTLESGKTYMIDIRFAAPTNKQEQATTASPGNPVVWAWMRFASNSYRNRFASQDDLVRAAQAFHVSRGQPRPTRMTVPTRIGEYELQVVVSTAEDGSMPPDMFHRGHVVASAMIRVVP